MSRRLDGRVALVVGGSRGIGAATAIALARQGATVAITYCSDKADAELVVAESRQQGVASEALQYDQGQSDQAKPTIDWVVETFGRLDVLVNNAAIFRTGLLGDQDEADLEEQYRVNLHGVIANIRAGAAVMGDGGRIISISSSLVNHIGMPGVADYTATKAAVEAYSRGIARDLAPRGITVNVVRVGSVDTDMNPSNSPGGDWQRATMAIHRYGRPEEVAAGVVFLAGPDASFVTGSALAVDGGWGS